MSDDFDNILDNLTTEELQELESYSKTENVKKSSQLRDLALIEENTFKENKNIPRVKLFEAEVVEKPVKKPSKSERKTFNNTNTDFDLNKQKAKLEAADQDLDKLMENLIEDDLIGCEDLLEDKKTTPKEEQIQIKEEIIDPKWLTVEQLIDKFKNSGDTVLNLTNNNITYYIGYKLFQFICSPDCKIEKLIMANCALNDIHMEELGNALGNNKTLTELNIESNRIGGNGFLILFDELMKNNTITHMRMVNQGSMMSDFSETRLEELVREKENIITVSYDSKQRYMKEKIDKLMMRNRDILRKKRNQIKK